MLPSPGSAIHTALPRFRRKPVQQRIGDQNISKLPHIEFVMKSSAPPLRRSTNREHHAVYDLAALVAELQCVSAHFRCP